MEQRSMEVTQNQADDEMVIDLKEVVSMIWHNLLLIIEAALCVGAVFFLVCSFFVSAKYVSTTKIYIRNKQSDTTSMTYSDLQSGAALTKDYKELIKSLPVLEQVIAQLRLDMSSNGLADRITVNSATDTRIIEISVTDTDPYRANEIANAVRVSASKQIAQIMDIEAVNIVQKASYPEGKSSPSAMKMTMIGCLVGAFLAIGILFVIYILDDTIKTQEDVEQIMGTALLGSIPILKSEMNSKKSKGKRKQQRRAPNTRREVRKRA